MPESIIQRAFAAGEIAPALHARADLAKYTLGLRTCRNFIVRREGGISNRPGFRFVEPCVTNDQGTRLMRYISAVPGDSFLIEMGDAYFRFFWNGAPLQVAGVSPYNALTDYLPGDLVTSGGSTYYAVAATTGNAPPNVSYWHELVDNLFSIPTPYGLSELPDWNQSGNVITLTHPAHPPRELVFYSEAHWVLRNVTTTPWDGIPQNVAGTPGGAGTLIYSYIVTAAAADTYEESNPSSPGVLGGGVTPTPAAPNVVTWDAVVGAAEYYVYCDPFQNGVFGFVGTAATNSFKDTGAVPDFSLSPPIAENRFDTTGDYPAHSANYQQRRFFANTDNEPDAFWGSRVGFPSNFGVSSPLQDDDAVSFRLAGNNQHAIRHMVALKAGLILLTDGGEWTATGGGGPKTPITPSSINADQETYVGVSEWVRPAVIGNAIVYVQARGTVLHDLHFDQEVEGLAGRDLTIFSTHLFERHTVDGLDYQQTPHSIVWAIRDDGTLLGLTYVPEQDIWGWHRHDTDGAVEDICVVPEADEDVLYAIIAREVDGDTVRYIERLERRDLLPGFTHATSFFVDSGLSYSGAPVSSVSGLDHLEGRVVAVFADGNVLYDGDPDGEDAADWTVTAGAIALGGNYQNVHVGLRIVFEAETLDVDAQGTALRDAQKRTGAVALLLEQSSLRFSAGPDANNLRDFVPQTWDGTAYLNTGQWELRIDSQFNRYGRVFLRMKGPLPITILGVVPNVDVGG